MADRVHSTSVPLSSGPLPAGSIIPTKLFDRVQEIRHNMASSPLWEVLRELQGGRCFYCMRHISAHSRRTGRRKANWTRDHVVPRAKGGWYFGNIVLSCRSCNQGKADRLPSALELAAVRQIWAAVLIVKPDVLVSFRRPYLLH